MAASFFFQKNKKGRSQNSPSPVPDLDEGLDSSNEIFGETPDTSTLGVTLSPIKRTEVIGQPRFEVKDLPTGTGFAVVVYAVNEKVSFHLKKKPT